VLSQTIVVVAGAQRARLFISADLRHFSLNARHEAENACIRRIRVVEAERVGKVGYSLSPDLGLILTRSKIESIGGFLAMMVLLWKFRP
jgi:hypothetical protein